MHGSSQLPVGESPLGGPWALGKVRAHSAGQGGLGVHPRPVPQPRAMHVP